MFHAPPGVILVAQPRPETLTAKGPEEDIAERARFIQERRLWRAVIEAESRRLEIFLRSCTFD
jgi:hypothetical protein